MPNLSQIIIRALSIIIIFFSSNSCNIYGKKKSNKSEKPDTAAEVNTLESDEVLDPLFLEGAKLYEDNCSGCHGPLDSSEVRNRTFEQNKAALSEVTTMASLVKLQALSDEDIEKITYALSYDFGAEDNGKYPLLLNRSTLASKFTNFFNGDGVEKIDKVIHDNIAKRSAEISGLCTGFEKDCFNVSPIAADTESQNSSTIVSNNILRSGYIQKTCELVLNSDQAVTQALQIASLGIDSALSIENIKTLFSTFFPGQVINATTSDSFANYVKTAQSAELPATDQWRFLLLALCRSSLFEADTSASANELRIFQKCYHQLTQLHPQPDNTLLNSVRKGATSGANACIEILNSAKLTETSEGIFSLEQESEQSKAVLKTMHSLHSDWLEHRSFPLIGGQIASIAVKVLYPVNQPALFFTLALLNKQTPYHSVVTSDQYLFAERNQKNPVDSGVGGPSHERDQWIFAVDPKLEFVDTGELLGIRAVKDYPAWKYEYLRGNDPTKRRTGEIPVYANFGQGFFTTHPYLLMNVDESPTFQADGVIAVPRKWARTTIKDLLCRDLPVVRYEDAEPFVVQDSDGPFRQNRTCIVCHATIDRMAYTIRDFRYQSHGRRLDSPNRAGFFADFFTGTKASAVSGWPAKSDPDFFKRPTTGHFMFRSYNGVLTDKELNGLEDLSETLKNLDDLYLCAAKRYFSYFTAFDFEIYDQGETGAPKRSEVEQEWFDFVESLAKDMKETQDPLLTIEKIINSKYYLEQ